ncbi:hypothetical protein ETAE_0697 [Edwardsiella piscicida]|uniref:Uncharacterized protein n=2 Tax=Edwardsiella TaxID=635 RepID=A0A0H3DN02_EDWTF|nr:hypothetical protein ETAE_0697 [Edwardsiella tarda EIB202]ADM40763.1 hypothetical protein ETAF_0639 [Edwardsiella tarda FL6-60]
MLKCGVYILSLSMIKILVNIFKFTFCYNGARAFAGKRVIFPAGAMP